MRIDVIGVHPIEAEEPCHLIEILVADGSSTAAVESITQEVAGEPRENWQVPYDEVYLTAGGERVHDSDSTSTARVAFFFHYLDLTRPLLTAAGPVSLPGESPRPSRLRFKHYEPPC